MKYIIFNYLLILLLVNNSSAQNRNELQNHSNYYSNKLITASSFIEKTNSDSLKLHLYYRLPINNYLLRQSSNGKFTGIANLTIVLSDKDGVVRFHRLFNDTINSTKSQFLPNELIFKDSNLTLTIPNQNYQLEIRVNDGNSRKSDKVTINHIVLDTAQKLSASLLMLNKIENNQLKPTYLFNNFGYSKFPKVILINFFSNNDYLNLTYKIQKINSEDEYNLELSDFSGSVEKIKLDDIKFHNFSPEINYNTRATSDKEENGQNYYIIDFLNNPFVPGTYKLEIYSNNRIIYSTKFKVIWDDQPITLYNMNVALKISEIFLTKSELDEIRSLNRKFQLRGLIDVWKKLDKNTPLDNYPEAMIEFYKRADYAYYSFSTFAERNGALTDKGKVYILNGPPDKIEEVFKMKKLNEIWTYSNLIKEYTFESVESGVFKLVSIKE